MCRIIACVFRYGVSLTGTSVSVSNQGDGVERETDGQSQGSATWLVDPKDAKRTISTKYETTIF